MKIIALNGPPGCGKDAIGKILTQELTDEGWPALTVKFARPLKAIACQMLGIRYDDIEAVKDLKLCEIDQYVTTKSSLIRNWTLRQLLIWISEAIMKPYLGADVFGRLLLSELQAINENGVSWTHLTGSHIPDFAIITDGGFQSEFLPLIEWLDPADILVVEVFRENCSFEGDSRDYVGSKLCISHNTRLIKLTNYEDKLDATVAELITKLEDFGWLKSSTQQT